MTCNPDKSNNCADINFAPCVRYELDLPAISNIDTQCVNLENTTADLYEIVTDIQEQIPNNLETTIETLQSQIVTLQTQVLALQQESICLKDITECVTIPGVDPCGEPVENLGQVLNYILSQLSNT